MTDTHLYDSMLVGSRTYELTNHLGNVLMIISDKKVGSDSSGRVNFYLAEVLSQTDYYPFGMAMPNRGYLVNNSYRYGFNGKEQDSEVYGSGNQQDYGMRIYDPRVGRFLSVDPLTKHFPFYTPYSFAGNKPIWAIDLDGLEELIHQYLYKDGKATKIRTITNYEVKNIIKYSASPTTLVPIAVKDYIKVRNGKPLPANEVNQVQYQYFDEKGNRLNIRRTIAGGYASGNNELMRAGDNNLFGSVYIGPYNPQIKISGEKSDDYRREPQDLMDAGALEHDLNYDKVGAKSIKGALFDAKTISADLLLINRAEEVIEKAKKNEIDPHTNKPISDQTVTKARRVKSLFEMIVSQKVKRLANSTKSSSD